MRVEWPTGEFTQTLPTGKVPVGPTSPCHAPRHVAAENLGKIDTILALLRDKWLSPTLGLDHCAVNVSHPLRGREAKTGGLKG
jgi:hypothetical protein